MRKKYFLTRLAIFGFLALGTATTFVGCKDYDGDITELQTQIDANKADYTSVLNDKLAAVNSQITALQGTQTALQATVATAQTAATAAKTSSDAAAAAAAAAQLAAAQAKLDAINNAAAALATVKTELATRISTLDAKFENLKSTTVTKEELAAINTSLLTELANAKSAIDAKIGTVSAQIDAVDSKYNTIVSTLATKNEVEVSLQTLKTELAAMNLQQSTFTAYQKVVNDQFAALKSEITKINGDVPADSARISALEKKVGTLEATLTTAIATAKSEAIAAAVAADTQMAASLQQLWVAYTNATLDNFINVTYKPEMEAIHNELEDLSAKINTVLNTMNAIFSHRLTSMAFVPQLYSEGIPTIYMFKLNYIELGKTTPLVAYNHPCVKYRMNPSGVMLSDISAFDYTGEKAVTTKALGNDPAAPISVASAESLENGVLTLKLQRNESIPFATAPEFNIVSLKATLANKALTSTEAAGSVAVYSEYVRTSQVCLSSDKLNIAKKGELTYHYQVAQVDAQNLPSPEATFTYDGSLDLKTLVASCYLAGSDHIAFDEANYGFTYRFAMAPNAYNLSSGGVTTNQQNFASVTTNGIMTARVYQDNPLNAAIGRTPIAMVELLDPSGLVVKRAFIKIKITAPKPAALTIVSKSTITVGCLDRDFAFNVERLNREVYNVLPMSYEQFWNNYNFDNGTVSSPITTKPILKSSTNDGTTYSNEVHWMFNDSEFGIIPDGGKTFIAECKCVSKYEDASNLPDVIFRFEITVNKPTISIVGKELTYWTSEGTAFKVNVAVPTSTHDGNPANCIYSADLKNAFNKDANGNVKLNSAPTCGCLKFRIVNPSVPTGIYIDANDNIGLDRSSMTATEISALNAGTLSVVVMPYYSWNGMSQDLGSFTVKFISPFIGVTVTTTHSFTDAVSGGSKICYYGPYHQVDAILKDWRDVTVSENQSLWEFYGLSSYIVNAPNGITTNLKEVGGNLVPTEGYQDGAVPKDVQLVKTQDPFGNRWLTYTNNGTPLTSDYDIFVPIQLNHKWGSIGTTLKIHVNKLGTVSSIKRK